MALGVGASASIAFPIATSVYDVACLTQPENDGIVNAIMTLGHGLGLEVVAECVETKAQLDFLQNNGCDVIQGYYFSKPLKSDQFIEYMTKNQ